MASRNADTFDEGGRFRVLRQTIDNPRDVLDGIGAMMVAEGQKAFRVKKLGGTRWKSRGETGMNPNWPGILADFSAGRSSPPERRFRDGPVMESTGRLKRSLAWRVVSRDTVEAGSNLPYAGPLHAGAESKTVRVTQEVQGRLWKWIKRARGAASRSSGENRQKAQARADATKALGWLLNKSITGQRLTITHPERPVIGLPPSLQQDIQAVFGRKIGEVP